MMTNEQKVEAYKMLLDGASIREVGERFGVSYQRIQQMFPRARRCGVEYECIYPNIKAWIYENCGNQTKFGEMIGACHKTVHNYLTGQNSPNKKTIDKILEVTGMTYEEAFKR